MAATLTIPSAEQLDKRVKACEDELRELKRLRRLARAAERVEAARARKDAAGEEVASAQH